MLLLWSQDGPGSDGNEGVLYFPQSSSITGATPSDCLMSYTGHSLVVGGSLTPLQSLSVCLRVYCFSPWQEINQKEESTEFYEAWIHALI